MQIKEIVKGIDLNALSALCIRYDDEVGEWPEHKYEGAALFSFFDSLKDTVEHNKEKQNRWKQKKKYLNYSKV